MQRFVCRLCGIGGGGDWADVVKMDKTHFDEQNHGKTKNTLILFMNTIQRNK